jgi:hypothetical protein
MASGARSAGDDQKAEQLFNACGEILFARNCWAQAWHPKGGGNWKKNKAISAATPNER